MSKEWYKPRHCKTCGATRKTGRCHSCDAVDYHFNASQFTESELSLGSGRWVLDPVTRVQRWESSKAPPTMPDDVLHNTERGYQWHRYNDPDNWPLPDADPCGCRAAHAAWVAFRASRARAERRAA